MRSLNLITSISGQRRRAQRCQGRACGLERVERFKDQQRRRPPRCLRMLDHVFQIPAFAQGNRACGQKSHQLAFDARGKIFFVRRVQERIKRYQPAKGRPGAPKFEPAHADLGSLSAKLIIDPGYRLDGQTGAAGLVYTRAQLLGRIAARIPVL